MTLDIKELRVGNLVKYKGHIVKWDKDDFYEETAISKTSPIEITEDILTLLGFKNNYQPTYYYLDISDKFYLAYQNETFYLVCGEYEDDYTIHPEVEDEINIKYIHQIQNLYYSLKGVEVEVDINKISEK